MFPFLNSSKLSKNVFAYFLFNTSFDLLSILDLCSCSLLCVIASLISKSLLAAEIKSINSELYSPEELHEYWGAVNGNWFGGPNDYYYQIQSNSYDFLYNYLGISELGDLNNDGNINIQDIVLTIDLVLNNEYHVSADLNLDSIIDVLDVVQLVAMVLR